MNDGRVVAGSRMKGRMMSRSWFGDVAGGGPEHVLGMLVSDIRMIWV